MGSCIQQCIFISRVGWICWKPHWYLETQLPNHHWSQEWEIHWVLQKASAGTLFDGWYGGKWGSRAPIKRSQAWKAGWDSINWSQKPPEIAGHTCQWEPQWITFHKELSCLHAHLIQKWYEAEMLLTHLILSRVLLTENVQVRCLFILIYQCVF